MAVFYDSFSTTGSQVRQTPEKLSARAAALGVDSDAALRAGRSGLDYGRVDRRDRRAGRRYPVAGQRGALLLLDAAPQADGKVPRADLHQYQLSAQRRRKALGARLQEARHRAQGSHRRRANLAGGGGEIGRASCMKTVETS